MGLDFKALKNANYPSASWKRMFITQPALRKMVCYIPAWRRNPYLSNLFTIWMPYEAKDSTGVKMGPLCKMVCNLWKDNEFGTGVEEHIVSDLTRQGYGEMALTLP